MNLDKVIEKRHSVRRFKSKKPDWRKIVEAIDSARTAPLAGNLQSLKFILVKDKEKIKKLGKACQQRFVSDVNYIVVVCCDKEKLKNSFDKRGEKYSQQQSGAAIENFLLKITDLGLASCWIGAFSDNQVKRILNIPSSIEVEALLPVGYEMGKEKQENKPDLENIMFFDKWGEKYFKPIRKPSG